MIPNRIAFVAAVVLLANPAHATDVCVSCTGPNKIYLCSVKKAEQIKDFAGDKTLNKICTQILRRSGPHASCSVLSGTPCQGEQKKIGWSEVKAALASGLDEVDALKREPAAGSKPASKAEDAAAPQPKPTAADPPGDTARKPEPTPADAKPDTGSTAATPAISNPKPNDAASVSDKNRPALDQSLKGAGDNIKDAAKKTWDCVSSMFGNC